MAGKKSACPVCGGKYADAYVAAHMRKAHNVYGGRRGYKAEAADNGKAVMVYQEPVIEPVPLTGLRFPANIKVGLGEDGSMWICEQVRAPRGRA